MMIWMLIFGWTIYFAQTQVSIKRIATTLVLCIIVLAITGNTFILTGSWPSSSGWILFGGMLILWQPYIYVPRWFKTLLQTVSAAAYHIYLTHMIFIHIIKSGMGVTNPLVKAIGALIGGILTWLTLQAVQQWFFERKRSNY
jgi:peptidoglycan/LPS O-acetylase OafA/YrhL